MYHPWDDDKGWASRGGSWLEVVYCRRVMTKQMALPRHPPGRRREERSAGKRDRRLSRPRILDEVPPLSVQDKTHFYIGRASARATLLPANTRFLKSRCGTGRFARVRRQDLNELYRLSGLLLCAMA